MPIQLEEVIGTGSYADVWRATDNLGRKVAVKVLRRTAPYHFEAMAHAKALARVKHTNVVTVYGLETVTVPDTHEEVDGVIMELIEGQTLQNRLQLQDRLEQQEVLFLSEGLVDGLAHIHSVGLVHNDLHSENVLVADGKVTIIDILYTDSLIKLTTNTREEKIRHDIRSLTTILFDIAQRSNLPEKTVREFGLALQDSTMSFSAMRKAIHGFAKQSEKSIISPNERTQRLKDAVTENRHNIRSLLAGYLSDFSRRLPEYGIDVQDQTTPIDEAVWISFKRMLPCRDEFIDLIDHLCRHSNGISNYKKELVECLQEIAAYSDYSRPNLGYRHNLWNDNFKLFIHELFLYISATLIKCGEYQMLFDLTHETYCIESHRGIEFSTFVQFREYAESIDNRSKRLELNLSLPGATLFKERATLPEIPFIDLMQADFSLFLISLLDYQAHRRVWFPITLLYASHGPPFKIFKRATARRYFDEIKLMFGVKTKSELVEKYIAAMRESKSIKNGIFQISDFEFIHISELANLDNLCDV